MSSLFESENYREFIRLRFSSRVKAGYGQAKRLAEYLSIHTTLVSQVLKGLKSFTPEQAAMTAEFLGLTDLESEYFLLLVQIDRAGNESLRNVLHKQLLNSRARSKELVNRLKSNRQLTETERAQFYSDWIYSAIRQMTAIPGFQTADEIAVALDLSLREVKGALEFLLCSGLVAEREGSLSAGPSMTHLESSSPWARSFHRNWRIKALGAFAESRHSDLHYSAPMTLAKADVLKIRELISGLLESVGTVVGPSMSEELHCLTIDWFKVQK